jgi:hypothetical protein
VIWKKHLQLENGQPYSSIQSSLALLCLTLLIAALGLGWHNLAQEVSIDGKFTRLALLAVTPCQILGPISQININSQFYSGKAACRLDRNQKILPHVTILMAVYKEGLVAIIQPTIISLKLRSQRMSFKAELQTSLSTSMAYNLFRKKKLKLAEISMKNIASAVFRVPNTNPSLKTATRCSCDEESSRRPPT